LGSNLPMRYPPGGGAQFWNWETGAYSFLSVLCYSVE